RKDEFASMDLKHEREFQCGIAAMRAVAAYKF
ncbi:hypothetical protein KIPB_005036, partial [Kipferlia bialata]